MEFKKAMIKRIQATAFKMVRARSCHMTPTISQHTAPLNESMISNTGLMPAALVTNAARRKAVPPHLIHHDSPSLGVTFSGELGAFFDIVITLDKI